MLWGRAAGRCEFGGCNRQVWRSPVTSETVNIAEKAHIWAFSEEGPRGHDGIEAGEVNSITNLMLVCHDCHRTIDRDKDGGRYSVELLQRMKREHEDRIDLVTGIDPSKKSHVLHYSAAVGDQPFLIDFMETSQALFPDRYPAENRPIDLGISNAPYQDRDADFWKVESDSLRTKFNRQVKSRLDTGESGHFSIFALAPQPLLIFLGSLLSDIQAVDVYQRHREPTGWKWPEEGVSIPFKVIEPKDMNGTPALLIALSATVSPDRIQAVLGEAASIWIVTVDEPNNDLIKTKSQLEEFRRLMRSLLDRIKSVHGDTSPLHVFPVGPVSIAVELGRVRMPKADMTWMVYDNLPSRDGFVPAIDISTK